MRTRRDLIEAELPLTVLEVDLNDPIINIIGDAWALTLMCPWAIHGPDMVFDWESLDLGNEVQGLVGRKLVAIEADSDELFDPVFVLDDGTHVHVSPDEAIDPGTMALPEIFISGRMRK